jgi:hypothetical protein
MVESIAKVMAWKLSLHGGDPMGTATLTSAGGGTARYPAGQSVAVRTVTGHRDLGVTACPGDYLYTQLDTVRRSAAAKIVVVPKANRDPSGSVEAIAPVAGGLRVMGWVKDPDSAEPVTVHVYVDGNGAGAYLADRLRTDLGGQFGIDVVIPVAPGNRRVCVYAINVGEGASNPELACRTAQRWSGDPVGNFEAALLAPGGIRLAGWVLDPDTSDPVATHTYVSGRYAGTSLAGQPRPDVGAVYPLLGSGRGLSATLPVPVGVHDVCVFAINHGAGVSNPLLGCRRATSLGSNPIGNFEGFVAGSGSATVSGWTLDPDIAGSISVHVYVDGRYVGNPRSDGARPDVAAAYPGWEAGRGYSLTVGGLAPGMHNACVFALNAGAGTDNTLLGCREVSVR